MKVSVICPVFNTGPSVLASAVGSVLNGAGTHEVQLVLVNDGSSEPATLAALRETARDGRVLVVDQPRNAGPAAARSAGIARAAHDWIGFIDSDDLWPAGKLDQAEAVLRERPDARWISGAFTTLLPGDVTQPSRLLTEDCPPAEAGATAQRLTAPASTRALVGAWHPLGSSLFQKGLIETAGGFDPRLLYGEDWLLCLRASTLAPIDYIEAPTYVLRRQGESLMRSPKRLSRRAVEGIEAARRDPLLRAARRELRWQCYASYKDVAMNNALNGRKLRGLGFALRALMIDPRELREFSMFLRLLGVPRPAMSEGFARYSTGEQLELSRISRLQ